MLQIIKSIASWAILQNKTYDVWRGQYLEACGPPIDITSSVATAEIEMESGPLIVELDDSQGEVNLDEIEFYPVASRETSGVQIMYGHIGSGKF